MLLCFNSMEFSSWTIRTLLREIIIRVLAIFCLHSRKIKRKLSICFTLVFFLIQKSGFQCFKMRLF